MKKLTKILISLLLMVLFIGCCNQKHISNNTEILGTSMKYELNINNGKTYQIDSLIKADTLPVLSNWIASTFVDYNTNKTITKRVYVRQYSKKCENVYIITGNNEPYGIIKRIKR